MEYNEHPAQILVVDDEEDLLEILAFNLEAQGYKVFTATSAQKALTMPLQRFDLFLLDVMMSGISGFRLAEIIRNDKILKTPIIFLTAKDTEEDLLKGFEKGADDYISKPFSIKEVVARIKAVLMRTQETKEKRILQTLAIANLVIDNDGKKVMVDEKEVQLTKKEYSILYLLAQKPGNVFTRDQILYDVWKGESYVLERTVDVHIARLRKKLHKAKIKIINRSGFGYFLAEEG